MNHRDTEAQRDPLTEAIIGGAIEVHRELGPGLLESAYAECLAHELSLAGLAFAREVRVPVRYKGLALDCGYKVDFVVDRRVVVELKAVEGVLPVHEAQLMTYMRLLEIKTGLLINFHVPVLKSGIRRFRI
jgi:GxxExxY protein